MRIAVIGASGMVGSRVVSEALLRDHSVLAVSRDPAGRAPFEGRVTVRRADAGNAASVTEAVDGSDVVVAAIRLDPPQPDAGAEAAADLHRATIRSLLAGVGTSTADRLVVVGGAGSLKVPPGVNLVDSPDFPERFRLNAAAQAAGLAELRLCEDLALTWSCICPPFSLAPGERSGRYQLGTEFLIRDADGQSAISAEDFAVAVVDEAEHPEHARQLFTVARLSPNGSNVNSLSDSAA